MTFIEIIQRSIHKGTRQIYTGLRKTLSLHKERVPISIKTEEAEKG